MRKLTNELVIEKLKSIYGDTLDYSKVNYINSRSPITLICPIHGEFLQYANNALQGRGGCPKCKIPLPDLESFVIKAKEVHGDKYDYSKVEYVNSSTDVTIICPIHGEFHLTPRNHVINKCNCPKCVSKKRKLDLSYNTLDFIRISNTVHNNKYDYSKVEYSGSKDKVCIICPEHGEFWQIAHNHMSGLGCPKCSNKIVSEKLKLTLTEFVNRSNAIHNNTYDYSLVDYVDYNSKVNIICPKHGVFLQTPHSHLNGSGCPKCAVNYHKTTEDFIVEASKIHNNKYSYDKVKYINIYTPITITCPKHGDFLQVPHNHLKGYGCPKCNASKGEIEISKCLEKMNINYVPLKTIQTDFIVKKGKYFIVDFYINFNNNTYIIEYNGKLHYEFILHFHKCEENFLLLSDRDLKLRNYCKNHNIKLLEIKYDVPFLEIYEIIKKFIYEQI